MFKSIAFLMKLSWKYNKKYIYLLAIYQLIAAAMPVVSIIMPKYIIAEILGDARVWYIAAYIGIFVGVNLIGSMLLSIIDGKMFVQKMVVSNQFNIDMYRRIALADYSSIESEEYLNARSKATRFLYSGGEGFSAILDRASEMIHGIIVLISVIAIITQLNVFVVIALIVLVALHTLSESQTEKTYSVWSLKRDVVERRGGYLAGLLEDYQYGKEVRAYNAFEMIIKKIKEQNDISFDFYKKRTKAFTKNSLINNLISGAQLALSYGYISFSLLMKYITVAEYSMYLGAISTFSSTLIEILHIVVYLRGFVPYYEAVDSFLNLPNKMRAGTITDVPETIDSIEFRNVSFKYENQPEYALKNVNIVINKNEKLSVVGENGAGKTTFIKLLCRLYAPTEGEILINGININDIDYDKYMEYLSVVFQDYKLFSFSLKENVAVSDAENVSDEDVEYCLKQSGFGDKLSTLPDGVETYIHKDFNDRGFDPSGGEGQKIAMARAFYKNAKLVILDEPTAALDPRAEYELYKKFDMLVKDKTAIYISHRLSSARFCDKIAVFDKGKLIEYGSHDELMAKNQKYAELYNMQAKYYK